MRFREHVNREGVDVLAGLRDFCFFSGSSMSRRLVESVCSIV